MLSVPGSLFQRGHVCSPLVALRQATAQCDCQRYMLGGGNQGRSSPLTLEMSIAAALGRRNAPVVPAARARVSTSHLSSQGCAMVTVEYPRCTATASVFAAAATRWGCCVASTNPPLCQQPRTANRSLLHMLRPMISMTTHAANTVTMTQAITCR